MNDPVHATLLFLVNTLFDLYLFVLIVRVILVYVGASYVDPAIQVIIKLTDPLVKPLRRYIVNVYGIELATVFLILFFEILKFICLSLLSFGLPSILSLLILTLADSLKLLIQTFFYAIILQAILSWIQPHAPASRLLFQFTSPIMRPFRRYMPLIGGVDLSPIPALIVLQLINILLIGSLMKLGLNMAFY